MYKTTSFWKGFIILEEMFGLKILNVVSKMTDCSSDGVFICVYYIRELYLCFS